MMNIKVIERIQSIINKKIDKNTYYKIWYKILICTLIILLNSCANKQENKTTDTNETILQNEPNLNHTPQTPRTYIPNHSF
jgi:PBP1b-binding outer membrane lipoprotein LpoB